MPNLPPSFKSLSYTAPKTPPHLLHQPLTPPGPNELLIRVKAAAINPVDLQLWNNSLIGFLAGKKEKGIGRDYSGVIVAVGSDLQGKWSEGDEVFGLFSRPTGEGTFSEYVKVAVPDPIARKPKCWSFEEAAAMPLVVLTAFSCLDWLPKEEEGVEKRRVVVAGASGGVGMWCVQLAKKLYKCHVTAICSHKNSDFVCGLGADTVIDYTTQNVAQVLLDGPPKYNAPGNYDLYIDCVGGTDMFDHWHELLHKNGAYVTIVGDKTSRSSMGGPLTYFTYPSQVVRYLRGWMFGPRYANVLLYGKSELLEQVIALAEKGDVEVVVQDVIKGVLDEKSDVWKRVFDLMEEGRVRGKIVVGIE